MAFSRDEPAPQSWRPPSLASGRADRPAGGVLRQLRDYQREVLALADWLRAWQVPAVVVEATGGHQRARTGGAHFFRMVRLNRWVAWLPAPSVTFMVNTNVPA